MTNDRYVTLTDAARMYITSVVPLGSFVGLVDFDDDAVVLSNLQQMTSDDVRKNLANSVPEDSEGGTCIGCGLREALNILKRSSYDVGGSKIMLITDGQDGNQAQTSAIKQEIIENKVIIDTIAITDSASQNSLAEQTGGKLYLQTDSRTSTGIRDAFANTQASGGIREYDRRIELQLAVASFSVSEAEFHKNVYIDETLGRSTIFDFTYFTKGGGAAIHVELTSPTGVIYDQSCSEYRNDLSFRKVIIKIPGTAKPGSWEYIIKNQATSEAHDVTISVSSYPSKEGVYPILVDSYLSSSEVDMRNNKPLVAYAEVRQGFYPVVNATVQAIVETPNGKNVKLRLYDNGVGADITKYDGIYSRYFTRYTGTGFYGFKLEVENNGTATVLTPGSWRFSGIRRSFDPDVLLSGNISIYGNDTMALPGGPPPVLVGIPAPNFTRRVSGGASSVPELPVGWAPDVDTTPPSKITDLRVFNTSYDEGLVYVSFTAPGDDLDFGSAHHYVIRWSNSSYGLRTKLEFYQEIDQVDVINGNLSDPAPFGSRESITFRISFPRQEATVSYLVGVYAIDEADNEAYMSNIAQAAFRRHIPPSLEEVMISTSGKPEMTTSTMKSTPTPTMQSTPTKDDDGGTNHRRRRLGVVIGGAGCIIFLTILGIILANVHRRYKNKESENVQTDNMKNDPANEAMLANV